MNDIHSLLATKLMENIQPIGAEYGSKSWFCIRKRGDLMRTINFYINGEEIARINPDGQVTITNKTKVKEAAGFLWGSIMNNQATKHSMNQSSCLVKVHNNENELILILYPNGTIGASAGFIPTDETIKFYKTFTSIWPKELTW